MHVQVESYAGHRGDQIPRRFRLDKRTVEVEEILDQWQGRQPLNMQPWLA